MAKVSDTYFLFSMINLNYAYNEIKSYVKKKLFSNLIEKEVEWERLRDLLRLAQKAASTYDPSQDETDDKGSLSRQTMNMFLNFLTSKTGLFLKKPLILELAETIDGTF